VRERNLWSQQKRLTIAKLGKPDQPSAQRTKNLTDMRHTQTDPNRVLPTLTMDQDDFIANLGREDMEWYHTFRTYVTDLIDIELFQVLFPKGVVSLLPVRTIVALGLAQRTFGWDTAHAIREAQRDLRLRHALGIAKSEDVPSEEAIERLNALMEGYTTRTGIDLQSLMLSTVIMPGSPVMKIGRDRILVYAARVA